MAVFVVLGLLCALAGYTIVWFLSFLVVALIAWLSSHRSARHLSDAIPVVRVTGKDPTASGLIRRFDESGSSELVYVWSTAA